MAPPRILFLTRFGTINAACRYRMAQYFPYFESAGFDCHLDALFPDEYIHRLFGSASRKQALVRLSPLIARSLLRRWWLLTRSVSRYDAVYLQYEALPYMPFWLERSLFRSGVGVVVDFDDAVNLTYERHRSRVLRRLLGTKIERVVRESSHVTVANRHLAEWAARFNPRVTILPNSLDLACYPAREHAGAEPGGSAVPIIGWIGTPVTATYLRLIEGPLRALRARFDFRLRVIGVPGFQMPGVEVEALPWSEETEVALLRECDIGVMPLTDDPWSRGKSALKLIQYLGAEIAAVASPVGANADVLTNGVNGFLAAGEEEWTHKLSLLLGDRELRRRLARAGRETAEEHYSVQRNTPRLLQLFQAGASR